MISKEKIGTLIQEKLNEGSYFVVSLDISSLNKIKLVVDSEEGITIEECVAFSRQIEHNLDREEEDFELEVTSPGLSSPLLVKPQYVKNIGRELKIQLVDNSKVLKGILQVVNKEGVELLEERKEKIEGHKKKQFVQQVHKIKFADIKSALIVIKF